MALITWDDSIKTGLWTVDTQHERWVGFINQLHEAMLAGKGKEIVGQTLTAMVDYTRTHFADEESLMFAHGYAKYAEHKAQHDACISKVLDLQRRAEGNEFGISRKVLNYLKDWLVFHIKGADQDFVPFLKSKGVL